VFAGGFSFRIFLFFSTKESIRIVIVDRKKERDMKNKKITQQMIAFQKLSFSHCAKTMSMLQKQTEYLMKTLVDHTPGMSEESKKMIEQWVDIYGQGINDLKEAVDDGCAKLETFLDSRAMSVFQDHTEKMFSAFVNQASWMPENLFKTMGELAAAYKDSCANFSKDLNDDIKRMEDAAGVSKKRRATSRRKG
jgi:hypothetical protein